MASLLQSLPSLTATIHLPSPSSEAAALAATAALSPGSSQQQQLGGGEGRSGVGAPGQCDPQAAAAVTLVLSGSYTRLFGLDGNNLTQQASRTGVHSDADLKVRCEKTVAFPGASPSGSMVFH